MQLHERLSHGQEEEKQNRFAVPFSEMKTRIHMTLIEDLGRQLFNTQIDPATLRARVEDELRERLSKEPGVSREDRERIALELAADILGHGPLERLLDDDTVSEIMCNGPYDIWVERAGRLHKTPVRFSDDGHLHAHHQQDGGPGRTPHRRVLADGRCSSARRQPCERHHPAAVADRPAADHP